MKQDRKSEMKTTKTPTKYFDWITILLTIILIMIVVFSSLPPLSIHFGSAATWISLAFILITFLVPYFMVKNGTDAGRVWLSISNGVAIVIVAACIVFSFRVMSDYSPKGLLFAIIITSLVYIFLGVFWFNSAFVDDEMNSEPLSESAAAVDHPIMNGHNPQDLLPDLSKSNPEVKRITIIDLEQSSANTPQTEEPQNTPPISVIHAPAAGLTGDDPSNPRLNKPDDN